MEGVFFTLIGAALFSQSWYVLGLYAEGRTMGVFVGGLGLISLGAITFTPMLLTGEGVSTANNLAEISIIKLLIIVWALYAVGVAAQGLWDFDERAIGFYSAFLAAASLVPFIYFVGELEQPYSNGVWLGPIGGYACPHRNRRNDVLCAVVYVQRAARGVWLVPASWRWRDSRSRAGDVIYSHFLGAKLLTAHARGSAAA